jgi:hypothetical protein
VPSYTFTIGDVASAAVSSDETTTDPRDLRLDADGDLDLSTGDLRFTSGADAALQSVGINLHWHRGEWFLDESLGVPWFTEILVKNPNPVIVREYLREAIADGDYISAITKLKLEYDPRARSVSVDWTAETDFDQVLGSSETVSV